jgi:WG containing repeat
MKRIFLVIFLILKIKFVFGQQFLMPYRKDNMWGYANEEGKIVITPQFKYAEFFKDKKYIYPGSLNKDNNLLKGIVKNYGTVISNPKYVSDILTVNELATLEPYNYKDSNSGYNNYINKIAYQSQLANNYFFVTLATSYFHISLENYEVQIIDSSAKVILDKLENIRFGNYYDNGYFNLIITKNGKDGIVNYKGDTIIKPIYDHLDYLYAENGNHFIKFKKGNNTGVVDLKNKIIVPPGKYEVKIYKNESGEALPFFVLKKADQTSIYNTKGKQVFPFVEKDIEVLENQKKYTFKLLNINDSPAEMEQVDVYTTTSPPPPPRYQEGDVNKATAPATNINEAKKLNNSTITNKISILISQHNFELLQPRSVSKKYLWEYKSSNKFGLVNMEDSTLVIEAQYDTLYWSSEKIEEEYILIARNNKQEGVITHTNKIIIPFKYNKITPIHKWANYKGKLYFIAQNEKGLMGLIDMENKIIIPQTYKFIGQLNLENDTTINFFVQNKKNTKGIKNNYNETMVAEKYQILMTTFYNTANLSDKIEYIIAQNTKGKFGVLTQGQNELVPFKYDSIFRID